MREGGHITCERPGRGSGANGTAGNQALSRRRRGASGKGFMLEHSGAIEQAVAEYRAAVAQDPGLSKAHGNLGLLLLRQGLHDDAIKTLAGIEDNGHDKREIHEKLAVLYRKKGDAHQADKEKARTVLEPSRVAAPDFTEPRVLLSGLKDDEPVVTAERHKRAGKP